MDIRFWRSSRQLVGISKLAFIIDLPFIPSLPYKSACELMMKCFRAAWLHCSATSWLLTLQQSQSLLLHIRLLGNACGSAGLLVSRFGAGVLRESSISVAHWRMRSALETLIFPKLFIPLLRHCMSFGNESLVVNILHPVLMFMHC